MIELQANVTKYILPFTVTLSTLPIFQTDDLRLLPSLNHHVPAIEIRDFNWENYDPVSSFLIRCPAASILNPSTPKLIQKSMMDVISVKTLELFQFKSGCSA